MMRSILFFMLVFIAAALPADTGISVGTPPAKEEISAAEALLSQHLPELRSLVDVLEKRAPKEYGKAIRDLSRSSKRLEGLKKRDRQLYEIEVRILQAQVKVDLATAQLQVAKLSSVEANLRDALQQRAVLRIERNQRARELLLDRAGQLNKEIRQLEEQVLKQQESMQEQTQREFEHIVRRAGQVRQKTSNGES